MAERVSAHCKAIDGLVSIAGVDERRHNGSQRRHDVDNADGDARGPAPRRIAPAEQSTARNAALSRRIKAIVSIRCRWRLNVSGFMPFTRAASTKSTPRWIMSRQASWTDFGIRRGFSLKSRPGEAANGRLTGIVRTFPLVGAASDT